MVVITANTANTAVAPNANARLTMTRDACARLLAIFQGLDKKETVAKHGKDQVMIWRRSYTTPPPLLADDR